jgi:hypothetical protein
MTADQLREILERKPFKPVEIATTSGDHFQVLEEGDVHYNSRRRPERVVVFTQDGLFHILDADQVASATVL